MKLIKKNNIFLEIYEMNMKESDAKTYFSKKFDLGFDLIILDQIFII